jgi:hypothetical protein
MIRTIIFATALLFSTHISAIDLTPYFNYKYKKEVYVVKEEFGIKKVIVPFHFNKSNTSFDLKKLIKIRPGMIRNITYTYADNASKATQKELNKKRIAAISDAFLRRLDKHAGGIVYETCIQTKESNRRQLFTGFVISFELANRNLGKTLEMELKGEKTDKTVKKDKRIFQIDTLSEYDYLLFRYEPDNSNRELKIAVAKLNKYKHWKERLIVTDVTGSMYPYNKQMILWLKLNYTNNGNQYYVFFNDGNGPMKRKPVGKTGGIYYAKNSDGFDAIVKTAVKAMNNSTGNYEVVENDVEGIIKGVKHFDKVKNIVLIADNNAPPRDSALFSEVEKPVHVVLCGVRDDRPIREAYINLAFKTKGSIHTMEQDLFFSVRTNEGKIFTFMGKKYIVKKGRLVPYKAI